MTDYYFWLGAESDECVEFDGDWSSFWDAKILKNLISETLHQPFIRALKPELRYRPIESFDISDVDALNLMKPQQEEQK